MKLARWPEKDYHLNYKVVKTDKKLSRKLNQVPTISIENHFVTKNMTIF